MKHLKEKSEQFNNPHHKILDTFPNPHVKKVALKGTEFTSLCPITRQPDYASIYIEYKPDKLCLESKSVKLYLGSYRNYAGFAEELTYKIKMDVQHVLECPVRVTTYFKSRGGISIGTEA